MMMSPPLTSTSMQMIPLLMMSATSTAALTLQEDVSQIFSAPPQVGYCFASLFVGDEDGEDSTVKGSRAHINATARLLEAHPEARVTIEGHGE